MQKVSKHAVCPMQKVSKYAVCLMQKVSKYLGESPFLIIKTRIAKLAKANEQVRGAGLG